MSQWGHDFRREYRELTVLHERWPDVPRIALTATADAPTRREIAERLSLEDAREKIRAGASLVQIYTSFIYQGPKLVRDIARNL